jgi:hypothetical protein
MVPEKIALSTLILHAGDFTDVTFERNLVY